MSQGEILEQRRLARQEKRERDADLMNLHRLAVDALRDASEAQEVRERALLQIDKWERGSLCNPRYIAEWRKILDLPLASLCQVMLHNDAEGVALRQNSPFGFLKDRTQ